MGLRSLSRHITEACLYFHSQSKFSRSIKVSCLKITKSRDVQVRVSLPIRSLSPTSIRASSYFHPRASSFYSIPIHPSIHPHARLQLTHAFSSLPLISHLPVVFCSVHPNHLKRQPITSPHTHPNPSTNQHPSRVCNAPTSNSKDSSQPHCPPVTRESSVSCTRACWGVGRLVLLPLEKKLGLFSLCCHSCLVLSCVAGQVRRATHLLVRTPTHVLGI